MTRAALVLAVTAVGCGDQAGALVDVTQSAQIADSVDQLHLYVGVAEGDATRFLGNVHDGDEIFLETPLAQRPYTIRLTPTAEMSAETPVRLVVIGKHEDGTANAFGVLDMPGLPSDLTLRYQLELQPIGSVGATDTGCVGNDGGVLIVSKDDEDCDGWRPEDGDCNDEHGGIHPDMYDGCEGESVGVDENCNDTADDGDLDGDGAICTRDCDDSDAARSPDLREDCDGGVDNDCDLEVDEGEPEVCMNGEDDDCNPLTTDLGLEEEVCADGADNDCDLAVDEGRLGDGGVLDDDLDGDGASCAVDCDDDNEAVKPGNTELCDGLDNNCDGAEDEGVNEDGDPALCINDCNDRNEHMYPGNREICDMFDNDCVPSTLAAPSPCFDYSEDPCQYGFRTCSLETGTYGQVCEPFLANPVSPDPVCDQFASCSTTDADRLSACGEPSHACTQMVLNTGAVCGESFYTLSAPNDPLGCQWAIIGGRFQQGWTVGLSSEGAPTQVAVSSACVVQFGVQAVPPGLQPGTFAVALVADNVYSHTEVFTIVPEKGTLCAIPSLVCP